MPPDKQMCKDKFYATNSKYPSPRSGDDNEEVIRHFFGEVQHPGREALARSVQGTVVVGLGDQLTLK